MKTDKRRFVEILVLVIIAGTAGYILLSNSADTVQPNSLNQNKADIQQPQPDELNTALPLSSAEQQKSEIKNIGDDDAVRGNPDASLVIVEFCDFQYTACAEAYPAIKRALEAYAGKVKFVYRDFPQSDVHAFARDAAEAGECAREQGKYWEYHDKLLESQEWKEKGAPQLKKYAEGLDLDIERFNSCFESRKYKDEVLKDLNDGKDLGITIIPAFFIKTPYFETPYLNTGANKILVGAQTFEDFQKVIEEELNKLKEKQKHGEVEFYSFEKGIVEAERYNRILFIYFRSDSCYWCMKFDAEVLTNKSVVDKINESFIPVAVDVDSEKKLSSKFNVFWTPAVVFMDSSGKELKKLVGFMDAERFLEELNEVSGRTSN